MTKYLLKISQCLVFVLLTFFGVSSNTHVIKYFFGTATKEYVCLAEPDTESQADSTEKKETEKKENKDYCISYSIFTFGELIEQRLDSLHKENEDFHVFKPQSPPPEASKA